MPNFGYDNYNGSPKIAYTPYNFRSIAEIPERYRSLFSSYHYFNSVQSRVLDDVLQSDKSLVVAAPTGSGKTVVFELAIVSLLLQLESKKYAGDFKIVYLGPVKALCSERYQDWSEKFYNFDLKILEITGDSDASEYTKLQDYHIVISTPEKWDSLTRKWKDNRHLMEMVKLILIDEVHIVSDETRGPTLEAVVSRLKTVQGTLLHDLRMVQATLIHKQKESNNFESQIMNSLSTVPVRFVAVSACIPNIEDVANWLGENNSPAIFHQISEEMRPVKLKKVVIGYNCPGNWSPFRFSITLMYKLKSILLSYANGKPALIFCSTRKGVLQASMVLFKDLTFQFTQEQREKLYFAANQLSEKKMKDLLLAGIGCHHAGISPADRYLVEDLFRAGFLPILVATSTLAMGVNLPAHLVIIMSTDQYVNGSYQEYPETQILQMIGRAGRPQYDTSATAVIMTKTSLKPRYERLVEGRELLESSLHQHLTEHINAEIVLHTVTDVAVAMDWIRSTFLYVCAARRPAHYSLSCSSSESHKIESKLQELCMRELNALASCGIVNMDGMDIKPTEMGRLMACYCVAFETMKLFQKVQGTESIIDLIKMLTKCAEFVDIQLRVSERKLLNTLNKKQGHECIRYPLPNRVKTKEQKINILIQATFGCLHIQDSGLLQESLKIIRIGQRVSKCFYQYIIKCIVGSGNINCYRLLLSTLRLTKCFSNRLWEDSIFVARQLDRIGSTYASLLAASGKTSFSALRDSNPRDIERIVNKSPPFGNDIKDAVNSLPQYKILVEVKEDNLVIIISIINEEFLKQSYIYVTLHSCATLVVGDPSQNILLLRENISDAFILNAGTILKSINLKEFDLKEVKIHLINDKWVGLDVETSIEVGIKHKTQQNAREYLKRFAFSQGHNKDGHSDKKEKFPKEVKRNSVKNISTSLVSKKESRTSYFDKLKERVKMLPNNTQVLMLKKGNPDTNKLNQKVNIYHTESLYNDEMSSENNTSPLKKIKKDVMCINTENKPVSENNFEVYMGNSSLVECEENIAIGDLPSRKTQEDNFKDEIYFNSFNGDFQSTNLSEYLCGSYNEGAKCYMDTIMDEDKLGISSNIQKDPMQDVYNTVYTEEKIQIPNFDLGEDKLLEETT